MDHDVPRDRDQDPDHADGTRPASGERPRANAVDPDHDRASDRAEPSASVDEGRSGVVPAGRAGADSGATPLVSIDEESEAEIPDRSSQNDIAGVGPRPGGDGRRRAD